MLKLSTLKSLKTKKNLLSFSAGVDSSALFFLLLDAKIDFDIAIVDYAVREQSTQEVAYANKLAKKYNLTCHLFNAPKIAKNFEANARKIRYAFFENLIKENHYENLLTAHHLGDRFEWMLMQFCKGAGCLELARMQEFDKRENYHLVRPLLHLDKSELLTYLKKNSIQYFEDESNLDLSIKRNSFRHKYSNPMLQEHLQGIKKSFEYIDKDIKSLDKNIQIHSIKKLFYFQSSNDKTADIRAIDKFLKQNDYMLSAKERASLEIKKTVVVGRKFLLNQEHGFVFLLAFQMQKNTLPKEFKEQCRLLKIEPKLRPYLYENGIVFLKLKLLLTSIK